VITEAMGKILGMAMAYGVSALGLFLAYVNYRRRVVRAERVMSRTAWAVVAAVVLVLVAGVWVVADLSTRAAAEAKEAAVVTESTDGETEPRATEAGVMGEVGEVDAVSGLDTAGEGAPTRASTSGAAPATGDGGAAPETAEERPGWSWVGVLVPAAIFLFATWVTAALHRRFATGIDPG